MALSALYGVLGLCNKCCRQATELPAQSQRPQQMLQGQPPRVGLDACTGKTRPMMGVWTTTTTPLRPRRRPRARWPAWPPARCASCAAPVAVGRIQVPQPVYERLRSCFVFEERGEVDVKGKGVMHTWYLVGRSDGQAGQPHTMRQSAIQRQH